jgi:hypothetical protein
MAKESFQKQVIKLQKRLNKVENELKDISNIIATTDKIDIGFWNKLKRKTQKAYEEARVIYKQWSDTEIPRAYFTNIQKQISRIKHIKFQPSKIINFSTFSKKDIHKRTINTILDDSISTYFLGLQMGEKKLNRLMGLTQQLNVQEKTVNKAIEEGFGKGAEGVKFDKKVGRGSLYGAQRQLQKDLMKDALNEQYITVIDKNGKPINYNIKSYAELVARTKLIEAQSSSTVNLSLDYGSGLVQVSAHNTQTEYDAQFEGKVFDLTGKNPRFPTATDLPPFHPNCQHVLTVFFEEALTDKQLEKISDFSKGKIEIHPTRKSHIPLSKRRF